jgi:hypothetical protein
MGADRIQAGITSDPYDSPGAIAVDPLSGTLSVATAAGLQLAQSALAKFVAQTTLTNITTAQTLFSKAIAAGLLNLVGRTLLVTGFGVYSSAGGSTPTITIALTLGGVTLCTITSTAINTAANTNLQFQFQFQATVVSVGASATLECHGDVAINLSANTPGSALSEFADQNTAVSSAVNLTAAATLAATIAASGTVSSATLRLASVELVA